MRLHTLVFAACCAASSLAFGHSFTLGNLHIGHPFAYPTVPGQQSGAAYLTVENKGTETDRLVSVSAPVAKSAEIHNMRMEGDVMRMREVPQLDIPPAAKTSLKPGDAHHIMLLGLGQPLKLGERFPMTLNFAKAGKVEVEVVVQDRNKPAAASAPSASAHKH